MALYSILSLACILLATPGAILQTPVEGAGDAKRVFAGRLLDWRGELVKGGGLTVLAGVRRGAPPMRTDDEGRFRDLRDRLAREPDLTNQELVARYRKAVGAHDARSRDLLLREMARRGGARWVEFITTEIESLGKRPHPLSDPSVALWTALRMAERKPLPFVLECADVEPIHSVFPTLPLARVRIRNIDQEGARVTIKVDATQPTTEFFSVEARDDAGRSIMLNPTGDGGNAGFHELRSGDSVTASVDISKLGGVASPDRMVVVVSYLHAVSEISADGALDCYSLRSQPFRIQWKPRTLPMKAVEAASVAAVLRQIPTDAPAVVGRKGTSYGTSDVQRRLGGEARIIEAGYAALPGLLAALDSCRDNPNRCAQILALLYSVTGLYDPRGIGASSPSSVEFRRGAALGRYVYAGVESISGVYVHSDVFETSGIDRTAQDDLVQQWQALSRYIRIE